MTKLTNTEIDEAIEFIGKAFDEAELYRTPGYGYFIPNHVWFLANEHPSDRKKYLLNKRFEILEKLNEIGNVWLCRFNLCDFADTEFVDYLCTYYHNYINVVSKALSTSPDSPHNMEHYKNKYLKEEYINFYYDYDNITTYDRWLSESKPKGLPTSLFNKKQKIEFLRIENRLIDEGWLDPKLVWTHKGDHKSLQYLLYKLCQNNIFQDHDTSKNSITTYKKLIPIIERWEYDKIDDFVKNYFKASKFRNASPRYDTKGNPLDFMFLDINPQ